MQGGFGICTFSLPIMHSNEQFEDQKSFILMKACPLCQDWFLTNDIIVASCGHIYHSFCLCSHL